jgi:hypothetical protein
MAALATHIPTIQLVTEADTMTSETKACCPPFQPEVWDEKEISWQGKPFVRDRVRSFLHMPLNFGTVLQRNWSRIEAADAAPEERLVLSDENSLWGADMYIAVTKDVPNARMATLSGTFLTKVFEGPYKNVRLLIDRMRQYVKCRGKNIKSLYFYYTTCPRCAKKYGKNYVVLLAQV